MPSGKACQRVPIRSDFGRATRSHCEISNRTKTMLAFGVAVDANILINERAREEARKTGGVISALEAGFRVPTAPSSTPTRPRS